VGWFITLSPVERLAMITELSANGMIERYLSDSTKPRLRDQAGIAHYFFRKCESPFTFTLWLFIYLIDIFNIFLGLVEYLLIYKTGMKT
jgi:hypothetical protein